MKIAVISPLPAVPPFEGSRSRILALTRQIRELGHEVHFILLPTRDTLSADLDLHIAEFGADRFLRLPRSRLGNLRHMAKRLLMTGKRRLLGLAGSADASYFGLDEYFYAASVSALRGLQAERRFDAVFVEYVFASAAFKAFPADLYKILDTHDTFADRHTQFGKNPDPKLYWYSVPPSRELDGMRRADTVIAIQQTEAEAFRKRLKTEKPVVATISHALAIGETNIDFSPPGALFIGSGARPNVDAIAYFTDAILPLILAKAPDFVLHMVGSICKHTPDHPAIRKHGRIESLADAYRLAPLSLNPMRLGTGINIKLLEAMSMGVATVTTETGARGLGTDYSSGAVIVDDKDAAGFAAAVLRFIADPALKAEFGANALDAGHRWNRQQLTALDEVLKRAADRRNQARH